MTKANNERYEHAIHNELACNYLNLNGEMKDWVITTAFYSALHFVSSKIFPFKVPAIEGKTTSIENIDQYYNYTKAKGNKITKHDLLLSLVDKHFPNGSTYSQYDWLLSAASTARYKHYHHEPEISRKAIDYLQKIKITCSN